MPLHVICPGCLRRFQVGIRFAGMEGPCPHCSTMIPVPKESVKMHVADGMEAESGKEEGKKHGNSNHPIPRLDLEFDPVLVRLYAVATLIILLSAFVIGCIPMYVAFRSFIGTLGLCLIAFPLTLFGYHVMRDREEIFAFTGNELYHRTGIAAAGYVLIWLGFEYYLASTRADAFFSVFYFAVFAALAALLAHPLLKLKTGDAFLHYCMFALPVVLLRFLIGIGWFWELSEKIRNSASPPPLLPGM